MPINMEIRPTAPLMEKMLKKRQLFGVSLDRTRGPRDGKPSHQHPEGQLSVVADGLLIIGVEGASLMLPPRRIGWIPAETVHAGASYGTRMGWVAYLHRSLCGRLPKRPTILKLTPLTEALFARICHAGMNRTSNGAPANKLMDVLLGELQSAESDDLQLPIPADQRLASMAAKLIQDPSDNRSLSAFARSIGFSERSLSRHFRIETNMSFVEWRTMARMKRALEQMAEGSSVTDTAIAVGYDSVSSFIVQFRRTFGTTPAQYRRGPGRHSSIGY
jgi:AraC-like DNA-binding protein